MSRGSTRRITHPYDQEDTEYSHTPHKGHSKQSKRHMGESQLPHMTSALGSEPMSPDHQSLNAR